MARIRSIKPSLWSDEKFVRLTRDARLLYVGLISFADDEGRFVASLPAIAGYVYPHDDIPTKTLRRWLDEVGSPGGLAHLYEVDGLRYGALLKYRAHQRISHPQPSCLPAPQGVLL